MQKHSSTNSIIINAQISKVWNMLQNPEAVKYYMHGAVISSDWQEGSAITYSGDWNGQKYQDKGTILKIEPEKLLSTTYWSSFSGKEDKPENYSVVTYTLTPVEGGTNLTITTDNIDTQDEAKAIEQNWQSGMNLMKEYLEKQNQ